MELLKQNPKKSEIKPFMQHLAERIGGSFSHYSRPAFGYVLYTARYALGFYMGSNLDMLMSRMPETMRVLNMLNLIPPQTNPDKYVI